MEKIVRIILIDTLLENKFPNYSTVLIFTKGNNSIASEISQRQNVSVHFHIFINDLFCKNLGSY